MYYRDGDRWIAAAPKCATASLRNVLGGPLVRSDRIPQTDHVVMLVRDPMERLVSAYSWLKNYGHILVNWEGLVDAIADGIRVNVHWEPQADLHKVNGRLVPTEFRRFEDLDGVVGRAVPRLNTSPPVTVNQDYRIAEVRAYYAEDYELRRRCLPMS